MKDSEKIDRLKHCFEETIWMAIRYAHGRHTFAPSMVRDAIKEFQSVFSDWKPSFDLTIKAPDDELESFQLRSDYLDDLFEET